MFKFSWQSINYHHFLLIAVLLLALGLRLWGVGFGLPYVGSYDDEMFLTDRAIHLLRQDRPDSSYWGIGLAQVYLQAAVGKIVFAAYGLDAGQVPTYRELIRANNITAAAIDVPYPVPAYYFWGRVSIAVLGGVSVVLLYLIGKSMKSKSVGLISAFFLAAISLHAEHSHYITRAAPGLFLLLAAFYIILLACLNRNWRLYAGSLPLVYVAIYTKQNNLIILAPLILALTLSLGQEFKARPVGRLLTLVGVVAGLSAVVLTLGWFFFDFNIFVYGRNIFRRIFFHPFVHGGYQFGYSGGSAPRWIVERLFLDPRATWRLIPLLAIPGIPLAFQLKEGGWLSLALLLPYLLMMSFFTVYFENWLIPIVPFMALLAALSLEWVYQRIDRSGLIKQPYWRLLFGLIIILIPIGSMRTTATLNYYAGQPDVRQTAEMWLRANLPPDSKVAVDSWGPYLAGAPFEVMYVDFLADHDLQFYRETQVDYLVFNSININRRIIAAQRDPQAYDTVTSRTDNLTYMTQQASLEQVFVGPALLNPPVIEVLVYKVE